MRILEKVSEVDFDKGNGLVPVVVQDRSTSTVLMLGYMNTEALQKTMTSGKVTFYSRSKSRLWTKGETSGNFLLLEEILVDCDSDTVLVKVIPQGPTCHLGDDTCFAEENTHGLEFLGHLTKVIKSRRENPTEKSYTASLFEKGINKIAQKVGEEAVELVIEAKDDNDDLFTNEAADLLFHYMILLEKKGFTLRDIVSVLKQRHS